MVRSPGQSALRWLHEQQHHNSDQYIRSDYGVLRVDAPVIANPGEAALAQRLAQRVSSLFV